MTTPTVQQCTGCGARVAFGHAGLSTSCLYCDSPMVDDERASASVDAVVPFRVPRRGAAEHLRAYLETRRWAPPQLRQLRLYTGSPRAGGDADGLRGVLVPFWVYEGVVRSRYRAKVGVHWYREERYEDAEGKTRTRRVRETEWFPLRGSAARQVEDHLVSASRGLDEGEAGGLAPFDLGWATPYDPRILSGFEAELPTIAGPDAEATALEQLRASEATRIQHELLPGDANRLERISSTIEVGARRLVLLPVWIAVHRHGDVVLRLLVNGQTGRVVGRVPVSKAKVAALVLGVLALIGLAALLWWLGGRS